MIAFDFSPDMIENTPIGIYIYSISRERPHYSSGHLEIIYCLQGNPSIHISHEDISLEEGDIISCDSNDIRMLTCDKENLLASFYFDLTHPAFRNEELKDTFFICDKNILDKNRRTKLKPLKLLLLTMLYFHCFPHERANIDKILTDLSVKVMDLVYDEFHFFHCINGDIEYSPEIKNRIERILLYINRHFHEKITIQKLSAHEHISANYLSHLVKKTTFLGLPGIVNYYRIYYSELLLLTTHKNISQIAYETGFSDPKFYFKTFKRWYHQTPYQHRKKLELYAKESHPNTFYKTNDISSRLESRILYHFANLQLPESQISQTNRFRNVPYD